MAAGSSPETAAAGSSPDTAAAGCRLVVERVWQQEQHLVQLSGKAASACYGNVSLQDKGEDWLRHVAKTCNAGAGQPLWQSMDWHLSEYDRGQRGSAAN